MFAWVIMPLGVNSITAIDLLMASSLPLESKSCAFLFVTSIAVLITLYTVPSGVLTGAYAPYIHICSPLLLTLLNSPEAS